MGGQTRAPLEQGQAASAGDGVLSVQRAPLPHHASPEVKKTPRLAVARARERTSASLTGQIIACMQCWS
jgi:hypothetical protein